MGGDVGDADGLCEGRVWEGISGDEPCLGPVRVRQRALRGQSSHALTAIQW